MAGSFSLPTAEDIDFVKLQIGLLLDTAGCLENQSLAEHCAQTNICGAIF